MPCWMRLGGAGDVLLATGAVRGDPWSLNECMALYATPPLK